MAHLKKDKIKLLNRSKRIAGQATAVVNMIENEADCNKLLQSITAMRGALNGLMAEILQGHIHHHVLPSKGKLSLSQKQATETLIQVIKTYLK